MNEAPPSYVGISGVGSAEEHHAVAASFMEAGLPELGRFCLLGVKATTKPQLQNTENKYGPMWYPVGESLSQAVDPCYIIGEAVLQLYSDDWTDRKFQAEPLIDAALERSPWHRGLQFDRLPWMDEPDKSRLVLEHAAGLTQESFILQCYGDIIRQYEPDEVMPQLRSLHEDGLATYALFDASEGKGRLLDSDSLSYWLDAASQAMPNIGLVVAGGLEAEKVKTHVTPILRRFDNVSWDAESRLHLPTPEHGDTGALDMDKVRGYLSASAQAIQA
jgi:hypothetical protein